jgi:hypothetical protein
MRLLEPIWTSITAMSTGGGALYGSADGPRPGAETRVFVDETDGPRAERRRNLLTAPGSRSREQPRRGGEILGFVLGSAGHPRCL